MSELRFNTASHAGLQSVPSLSPPSALDIATSRSPDNISPRTAQLLDQLRYAPYKNDAPAEWVDEILKPTPEILLKDKPSTAESEDKGHQKPYAQVDAGYKDALISRSEQHRRRNRDMDRERKLDRKPKPDRQKSLQTSELGSATNTLPLPTPPKVVRTPPTKLEERERLREVDINGRKPVSVDKTQPNPLKKREERHPRVKEKLPTQPEPRRSSRADAPSPLKKPGFSSRMSSIILGPPPGPRISTPTNPVHVTHVSYNKETEQLIVSCESSESLCLLTGLGTSNRMGSLTSYGRYCRKCTPSMRKIRYESNSK